jgi:hypothetical protein
MSACAYEQVQLELTREEAAKPNFLPAEQETLPFSPLIPQNYQLLVQRLLSPHSPQESLLAAYAPGAGKSVLALLVADAQYRYHKESGAAGDPPRAFILGFGATKNAFQRELLRRPEFGLVSRAEIVEYTRLRGGGPDALRHFETRLRRRISSPQHGGRFRFFGYMEFYNRLFIFSSPSGTVGKSGKARKADGKAEGKAEGKMGEADLLAALLAGKIGVNWPLLQLLSGGLLACDEIHQAYNSEETNLYGLAVRVACRIFWDAEFREALIQADPGKKDLSLNLVPPKLLLLSGTPVGSAGEVVDLLNILLPPSRLLERLGKKTLEREDLFAGGALRPEAPRLISKLAKGYTAFLGRLSTGRYPRIAYEGERVGGLRLVRCLMGAAQQAAYEEVVGETLPPEAAPLLDLAFPIPARLAAASPSSPSSPARGKDGGKNEKKVKGAAEKQKGHAGKKMAKLPLGPLLPSQLKKLPPEEVLAAGLELVQDSNGNYICGDFLLHENLKRHSAKLRRFLDLLFECARRGGKMIAIHPLVRGSGVLLLADMLRRNGLLEEGASPGPSTLCAVCARPQTGHANEKHPFSPFRFLAVHGDLEENTIRARVALFESPDNLDGRRISLLLGSTVIGQGVDFSAVQHFFVLGLPENLFEYIQWVHRAARNGSHALLPPERQLVTVYTLVTALTSSREGGSPRDISRGYEERAYARMYREYSGETMAVQRALFEHAVDLRVTLPITDASGLGSLVLSPPRCAASSPLSFQLFHFEDEVRRQMKVIKRLLAVQRIYRLEDLKAAVRDPPFYVPVGKNAWKGRTAAGGVSEDAFVAALDRLAHSDGTRDVRPSGPVGTIDLFEDGPFLTSTSWGGEGESGESESGTLRVSTISSGRDTWVMSVPLSSPFSSENVDSPDAWARSASAAVDITERLKHQPAYEHLKLNYMLRYRAAPNEILLSSLELYDIHFHQRLLEDAIAYMVAFLTKGTRNELHDFYVRMLYFYYRLDLILYADLLPPELAARYTSLLLSPLQKGEKKGGKKGDKKGDKDEDSVKDKKDAKNGRKTAEPWQNAFLMDSITKTSLPFDPTALDRHRPGRVPAHLLPVGHFILPSPRLFHPERGWEEATLAAERPEAQTENDLIVGYYEKSPGAIELKFKLRTPVHKIVRHRDQRMTERGFICLTCKREELQETADLLSLSLQGSTIRDMCVEIKLELMRRELSARRRARHGTPPLRWFYMHFEHMPSGK